MHYPSSFYPKNILILLQKVTKQKIKINLAIKKNHIHILLKATKNMNKRLYPLNLMTLKLSWHHITSLFGNKIYLFALKTIDSWKSIDPYWKLINGVQWKNNQIDKSAWSWTTETIDGITINIFSMSGGGIVY